MERTGIVDWMDERLLDPRNPLLITYRLADLLRTSLLLLGQGWRDQDDADRLRHDPSFRVANDTRRGTSALQPDSVLPLAADVVTVGGSVERADQPGGGA